MINNTMTSCYEPEVKHNQTAAKHELPTQGIMVHRSGKYCFGVFLDIVVIP